MYIVTVWYGWKTWYKKKQEHPVSCSGGKDALWFTIISNKIMNYHLINKINKYSPGPSNVINGGYRYPVDKSLCTG